MSAVATVEEEPKPRLPEAPPTFDKGTRVRTITENPLWNNQEGEVTSTHTNGMIYVKLDSSPHVGSWAFSESELERIVA